MKPTIITVILLLFCQFSFLVISQSKETGGYSDVVLGLEKFVHSSSGGFKNTLDSPPSLDAVSHALFLSTMYGLKKINSAEVQRFLHTLQNLDYGFANRPGLASDLESVRNALLAYGYLGITVPNSANVANYITSLYDKNVHLYSNRPGEKPDLRSTAFALQSLSILKSQAAKSNAGSIRDALSKLIKDSKDGKYFQLQNSISDNYYGIIAASYVEFDFGDVSKWSNYILSFQSKEGGFFSDAAHTSTSIEATANAISALYTLQKHNKANSNLLSGVNVDNLIAYVSKCPNTLKAAAQAHLAVALATGFPVVETAISYESTDAKGIIGDRIVQGTHLKPVFTVSGFDGRIQHGGLDVEVTVTSSKSTPKTSKLVWNEESARYIAEDAIDTSQQLGELLVTVTAHSFIAEIGELKRTLTDKKMIGYGVTVASEANLAGKSIQEGETIGIGTELNFGVTLHNQTTDSFISGDFDMIFTVLDSSLVTIYSKSIDCRGNTKPITFSYTLKSSNIPAGDLTCRFEAKNKEFTHTRKDVVYNLAIPMVATEINFEGFTRKDTPSFKIGDTMKVSIIPASLPDLRTLHPYPTKDSSSKDILNNRNFFMDVSTPGGVVLNSVQGKAQDADGKARYVFTLPIDATIDSIGTHVVSFRYSPANKKDIALSNYDSVYGEAYDESAVLSFVVNAELVMVDVEESPKEADFFYGNDISFKFKLRDSVSKKTIVGTPLSNVYLSLKHQQPGKTRTFTSAVQPATHFYDNNGNPVGFQIKWAVNPNAVSGAGIIGVSAQDADGVQIPIYKEGTKKEEVQYKVNIGGNIDAQWNFFATKETHYEESAFILQFNLSCQGRRLKDAQLRCSVLRSDASTTLEELFQLPVASSDGMYEVSWTLPHKAVQSGDYQFQFFREVDRLRIGEAAEKKGKESADSTESIKPLFVVSVSHQAPSLAALPFRTEFFVTLVLGALFFGINYKKAKYSY